MRTTELAAISTDQLENTLVELESRIAACRRLQLQLLTEIDVRQVPMGDGARTLAEWVAARMDLAPETARTLTQTTARLADQDDLAEELETGGVSFDRVVKESRLAAVGADPGVVAGSRGWDIAGVRRMVARHHRITRGDEQQIFRDRFLSIQPALDQSSYKLSGCSPARTATSLNMPCNREPTTSRLCQTVGTLPDPNDKPTP